MNVVSLVILLVSAECGEVLEDVGVAPHQDIAGAQVMAEGVIVLVDVPLDVAVSHPGVAATAGRLIVDEMRCHMLTEMALGTNTGAGAELGYKLLVDLNLCRSFSNCVFTVLGLSYVCVSGVTPSASTGGFGCVFNTSVVSTCYCFMLHWFCASALLFRPSLPCCGIFNFKDCGSQLATLLDASFH